LLQCVTAAACAQFNPPPNINVELPPGNYALFASPGAALTAPPDPVLSKGGTASVPIQARFDRLYVWDKATGALAEKTISDSTKDWKVSAADFSRIETVTVAAQHNGQPLASGEISLGDGDSRHTAIVDQNAPATFFDVKSGKLNVTVKYREKDGTTGSVTQVFTAAPKPDGLNLTVAVADDVATGAGAPPASSQAGDLQGPPKVPAAKANPVGAAIVWLVAVLAVGFIVYNIMRFMKSNPGTVGQKLQQLGVQVPQPGDAGLSPAQPIMPAAVAPPQPVQKIDLGNAAPDPVGAAAPVFATPVGAISTGQPSLLSSSGVAIPLMDGETVVGREPGLGLSLTADSTVSRRHATLQKVGNDVTVTDLGSSNGTYVNGAKIAVPTVLRQGDAVQFGSAKFQYVI
jgi:hypothetical protein